jgi:hypothetical protein
MNPAEIGSFDWSSLKREAGGFLEQSAPKAFVSAFENKVANGFQRHSLSRTAYPPSSAVFLGW